MCIKYFEYTSAYIYHHRHIIDMGFNAMTWFVHTQDPIYSPCEADHRCIRRVMINRMLDCSDHLVA